MGTFALLTVVLLVVPPQRDVEVEAGFDRATVRVGETVMLYVRVRAPGVAAPEVTEPELPGLVIVRSEDRSSFRFALPGGATREFYREYLLRTERVGEIVVPPIGVRVGGRTYETQALRLTVVSASAAERLRRGVEPGPAEEVAVRLWVEPETVYVGQQATLTSAVFFDANLRERLRREPEVRGPEIQGAWVTDLATPTSPERRAIAGREFYVQWFKRALFPVDSGILSIPAASVVYEVRRGLVYAPQTFEITSAPVRLAVLPLPEAGRPPEFSGAVGRFTVDAWLDRAELRVGEAANLTFEARGTGNLAGLVRPAMLGVEGFRVYEAGESAETVPQRDTWTGRKRFSWVLVPERTGRVVVPPISLAYFDPQTPGYEVMRTGPLALEVRPAAALPIAEGAGGLAIRYVKTSRARNLPVQVRSSPLFWALQGVPPLAVLLLLLRQRRRRRSDVPSGRFLRRSRLQGFERIRGLARDPQADVFGELRQLALRWLEQRFGLAGLSAAGKVQLQHALEDRGVPPALAAEVAGFIEECARYRFAPSPLSLEARGDAVQRAAALLASVDREAPPRRRRLSAPRAIALLLLPAGFQSDRFAEGLAAYRAGDYETAVRVFEAEVAGGRPDPHALYNLGNAYYEAGEAGRAVYAWLRAAEADPRDADVRHNLRLASGDDPVLRDALPAVPLTRDELALLFALVWYGAGVSWIAYLVAGSRSVRRAGMALTAAALLLAVLFARATAREPVAILLDENVALRAGPALQSEALLYLPVGTALRVKEERENWIRGERPGMGEGWIPRVNAGVL